VDCGDRKRRGVAGPPTTMRGSTLRSAAELLLVDRAHVEPVAVDPKERAVLTLLAAGVARRIPIVGDELDRAGRVLFGAGICAEDLEALPPHVRGQIECGRARGRMPGRQEVRGVADGKCGVARAHQPVGRRRGQLARTLRPVQRATTRGEGGIGAAEAAERGTGRVHSGRIPRPAGPGAKRGVSHGV
jgi:hypothetical protein